MKEESKGNVLQVVLFTGLVVVVFCSMALALKPIISAACDVAEQGMGAMWSTTR